MNSGTSGTSVTEEQLADIRERVIEHAPMPTVDHLHALTRRRRIRRRTVLAAGVAAIALAGTSGVYGLRNVPPDGVKVAAEVSLVGALKVQSMVPAGARLVYAVVELKPKEYALAVSVDAGRSWTSRRLPEELQRGRVKAPQHELVPGVEQPQPGPIVILGPRTVAIGTMISHDAGESWEKAGRGGRVMPPDDSGDPVLAVGPPIAEAPAGWPIRLRRTPDPKNPNQDGPPTVDAVDPATNVDHPLRNQPGGATGSAERASDGAIWLTGDGGGNTTLISVSRDRGRSWYQSRVGGDDFRIQAMTTNGRTAYLLSSEPVSSAAGEKFSVWVSRNDGRTWSRSATIDDQFTSIGSLVMLSDGSLIGVGLARPDRPEGYVMIRSTDGGRTFVPIADVPVDPGPPPTHTGGAITAGPAGGYIFGAGMDLQKPRVPLYMVSTDGLRWQRVVPPPIR